MARRPRVDREILQMALAGYEQEKIKIDAAIASIQARLGLPSGAFAITDRGTLKRRTLSAAARRRIAAAQRKRWAAQRQAKKTAAPAKRKLSAAGRKAIAEAARKRWAALRKAKAQKSAPKAKATKAPATQ